MRVLVIVHGFPPSAQGGSEIYAHEHAQALRRVHGDEVLVLTREHDASRDEYAVRREARDGLRIVRVNNTFARTQRFEETYCNHAIGEIADRVIDEFQPDVAHVHHLTCLSTTIVESLAVRGVPTFMTLHDYWLLCHRGQLLDVDYHVCDGPEPAGCRSCLGASASAPPLAFSGRRMVRAIERSLPETPARQVRAAASRAAAWLSTPADGDVEARRRLEHMRAVAARVTHFFAPSRHLRDRFVRFGVAPERITLSPYGFDHAPYQGISRTVAPVLRLGFFGSLMVSKAPHALLDAVARLPRGSVSVDLFGAPTPYHGDDRYATELAPMLRDPRVRMRGPIPHDAVPAALASIDALVVPSIWPENSPLVIQEAYLAGVPVVASRIGGIPEVVEDGRSGLLFEAGDPADLARLLQRLLDEPSLLATLRRGVPAVRTIEDDVTSTRAWYARPAPRPRRRLAAVVLNFRTPADTVLAVRSLFASRRALDEIIVVDNDAEPQLGTGGGQTEDSPPPVPIAYVHTGRNLGFSGGMNAGIREALGRGADAVLLVNSDVVVAPDCVGELEDALFGTPGAGIAGPVVLARSTPDRIASLGMTLHVATGRMRHVGFGADADGTTVERARAVDAVSGCLVLIARDVFESSGLLDEDYFFSFEDLDFCVRARRKGFASVVAGRARAYHEGGRSMGAASADRLYYAARNHLLFASRATPAGSRALAAARSASIVGLNLAHAIKAGGGSLPQRVGAVARGTRDYLARRFGARP